MFFLKIWTRAPCIIRLYTLVPGHTDSSWPCVNSGNFFFSFSFSFFFFLTYIVLYMPWRFFSDMSSSEYHKGQRRCFGNSLETYKSLGSSPFSGMQPCSCSYCGFPTLQPQSPELTEIIGLFIAPPLLNSLCKQ